MRLRLLIWLAAEPGTLAPWLALAVSYLVHSLVWTGAAALLVRFRAKALSPAKRHLYWKVALFGPLFSAILAHAATGSAERSPASPAVYAREFAVGQPFSSSQSWLAWLPGACFLAATALGALRFTGSICQTSSSASRALGTDRRAFAEPASSSCAHEWACVESRSVSVTQSAARSSSVRQRCASLAGHSPR